MAGGAQLSVTDMRRSARHPVDYPVIAEHRTRGDIRLHISNPIRACGAGGKPRARHPGFGLDDEEGLNRAQVSHRLAPPRPPAMSRA